MERMLKRVGYYKKPVVNSDTESGNETVRGGSGPARSEVRRRARRQKQTTAERDDQLVARSDDVLLRRLLRVFHQNTSPACEWFSGANMMEFTPKALTRRFCGRNRCDNELYRSNSFKFERFDDKEEKNMDLAPLRKQVSLCDDYSLPVDFVNKRRPLSLGSVPNWTPSISYTDNVEVLENYSDPRDSKAYLEPGEEASGKLYTSPDRDYSQPYTDYSSEDRTPEEDDDVYEDVGNSDKLVERSFDRPIHTPYYYGDLLNRDITPDGPRMPPLRSTGAEAGEVDPDDMSRQRNFYETAFDSRVTRSDDDLDVDVVINKCILPSGKPLPRPGSSTVAGPGVFTPERRRTNLSRQELVKKKPRNIHIRAKDSVESVTQDITNLEIQDSPLPLRGFIPPTPPSSAPLPTKFPSSHSMASVHSAPNLPGARLKDARLPVKSLRCRLEDSRALEGRPKSFVENERTEIRFGRPKSLFCPTDISEFKGRPEETAKERPSFLGQVLEIKGRPRRVRVKYSSTESMATSSSGGSLESIRSSTSEGNRSTSSSESHRSSSLSSHSSDSTGSTGFHQVVGTPMGARFFQQTKLHILSPISDKSSQEPGSETSENNKNNNSHGASPEENTLASTPVVEQTWCQDSIVLQKPKRRTPQNKNLINLGIGQCSGDSETHQGSDSGISIESRCGVSGVHNQNVSVDLNDLPFDMPKLRRRRLLQQVPGVQDTSGSATSVDLKDLPFDMPKLRRRLRGAPPSTESSGVSQASSSHSVQEAESRPVSMPIMSRPSLTLDLETGPKQPRPMGLSLDLAETSAAIAGEDIEVDLPLERQGWYHGVITRLEAENVLRHTEEGSYLVRNSESSRLDYSLSLKSARGFMHMRIQQCRDTGKYILGQFSSPFNTIPEMIQHYSINRLPIRGAEHMCLLHPVIEQLL